MGVLLVVIVAVLLLGGLITGYISARRRSSGEGYLEPPRARGVETIDLDELEPNEPSSGVGVVVPEPDEATVAEIEEALGAAVEEVQEEAVRPRFRDRLSRARGTVAGYLGSIVSRSGITDETWEELEEALIRADVGVQTTQSLLDDLRKEVADKGVAEPEALLEQLKGDLKVRLSDGDRALRLDEGTTNVWLFVGVNGVGTTTTIGKVAKQQAQAGRSVVMAAGDTFRAAAAEQLGTWAERTGADFVRG